MIKGQGNLRLSDKLLRTTYQNPFSDIQARNFSDKRLYNEFVPTSIFWTLFNDQHEVVIGTRGSGKTILMRMMRYSMLKNIKDIKAKKLVAEKRYFALYVPMRYEFVESISSNDLTESEQNERFYFAFNCLLADSLIVELKSFLSDIATADRLVIEYELTKKISIMWGIENYLGKTDLNELRTAVRRIFYGYLFKNPSSQIFAPVFSKSLCSTLAAVNVEIAEILQLYEQPTWIVCVDEAEFLRPNQLKCISTVMRSESQHIAIKIADLPYYHDMSSPEGHKIHATVGNDYKQTLVCINENEFVKLTNILCRTRLQSIFEDRTNITLEDFVGKEGNDDYLDYFRVEFPATSSDRDIINGILENISKERRSTASRTQDRKILAQSIYKKLAPIYYLREMYLRSQKGNTKPGWYAGAKMIRRLSNGNPRMFLRIMDALFSKAQDARLTPKIQSDTLLMFSKRVCSETISLESCGPEVAMKLKRISEELNRRTHDDILKESGTSFCFYENEFEDQKKWVAIAVANSRLFVDNISMVNGLTKDSVFDISNIFATYYWIPMRRNSDHPRISVVINDVEEVMYSYTINKPKRSIKKECPGQTSMFSEIEVKNYEN